MSPSQFYREFGGGSAPRVERHFKRLAQYGWLRLVREESGGKRRGGREHFFRATELAVFESDTWSLLPYSVRAAYGWMTLKQLAERVREALEADTFDARLDRYIGSTSLLVDEQGRGRILDSMGVLYEMLIAEQAEARLRVFESGEKPFLVTTALAGFESPGVFQDRVHALRLAQGVDGVAPTYWLISKVLADQVCLSVLEVLNLEDMSVAQFDKEIGGASKSAIRHRFHMLEEIGWLAKVGKRPGVGRRGPSEHVYRAAGPVLSDSSIWSGVSASIRASDSWIAFETISNQIKEAIRTGTFDARPDRHFAWCLLLLDRLGWENVIAAIEERQAFVAEEQEKAGVRLAESDEEPVKMTVALMAFESPKSSAKAP
jgi:hypothetical protein